MKLDDGVCKLPKDAHSMTWSEIVPPLLSPLYSSPKADLCCQSCSDLPLLRQLDGTRIFNDASHGVWLGDRAAFEHQLLLGVEISGTLAWHHALFHLPSSSVAL